ncbi:MAG: cell division protein FtsL [Gammaproteobacteria bacterium]|nr:MAG: cell division protein FtsL [Gammaproteobacteria bacterium]
MAITQSWKQRHWIIFLVAVNITSATGVSYCVHLSRNIVAELQALKQESNALEVEWGQLLLEQSAWGSYLRVEKIASSKLNMKVPGADEMIMVGP